MSSDGKTRDMLQRPIMVGDLIAYPTTSDRSAKMNIYRVLEIKIEARNAYLNDQYCFYTLTVLHIKSNWGKNDRPSRINFPNKALILGKEIERILELGDISLE